MPNDFSVSRKQTETIDYLVLARFFCDAFYVYEKVCLQRFMAVFMADDEFTASSRMEQTLSVFSSHVLDDS